MSTKLFVGNLDFSAGEQDLRDIFSPFGAISLTSVPVDRDTGHTRGFGFVEYESSSDAERAMSNLDGTEFRGRNLRISLAREKRRDG